jgi:ribosomal protein S18 acetylase RimI-like enzyme
MTTFRPWKEGDLDKIVDIHLRAFPTSAMTRLGAGPVRRYYRTMLDTLPSPLDRVAEVDGVVSGYLLSYPVLNGPIAATGVFIRRNAPYIAFHLLTHPWLVLNRHVLVRVPLFWSLVRRMISRRASPATPAATGERWFNVLAIAVDPLTQGGGVGKGLMGLAEDEARRLGLDRLRLTVRPENARAIAFYEKLGYERVIEPNGVWRGRMLKVLEGTHD